MGFLASLYTTSATLNKPALITDIALHIFILWTFLCGFFFFYVSKIEKNAFENEFGNIIDENVPEILAKIDAKTGGVAKKALQDNTRILEIMYKIYDKPDPVVKSYNNWLMLVAFSISAIMFVMIVTGVTIYGSGGCKIPTSKQIPLPKIIVKNLITFFLVAIIEGLFFFFIAKNFIPAKPSQLVSDMISRIKQNVGI
jgi:uncharacterized membrane-anchored protein